MKKILFLFTFCFAVNSKLSAYPLLYTKFYLVEEKGNDFRFGLFSEWAMGTGGRGPRVVATTTLQCNDTLYVKALYRLPNIFAASWSYSLDSLDCSLPSSDIHYINVSSNEIYMGDTTWNLFDSTFILSSTAVIKEPSSDKKLSIYPNPANQYIKVQSTEWQKMVICNEMGQIVIQQEQYKGKTEHIDIHSLSTGHYFLSLFDNERKRIGIANFYKQD
jgi:hypothetical protein